MSSENFLFEGMDEKVGYTGKKHKNYIWIPKPKSDLKEYRDILRLCKILEEKEGYFNDKTLGLAQVEKGAIFDGSLDAKEYIKKYKNKTIGNQSYISNARMSIRMARWIGWITRFAKEDAKYRLTTRGLLLSQFIGEFPGQIGKVNEFDIMLDDILGMRFYCINDIPRYQNRIFKQRIIVNILRFLKDHEFMHNYEIVVTALTLKIEEEKDIALAYSRINRLRAGEINISEALKECGIDPNDNSSLTGVYDGPKVLCSFLKQLNLLKPVETSKLGQKVMNYYKKAYTGSLINNVPRNVFKITDFGKETLNRKLLEVPIWYEDLPNPKDKFATALILLKRGLLNNNSLERLNVEYELKKLFEKIGLLSQLNELRELDEKRLNFEVYRDVPPEDYENVKTILLKEQKPETLEIKIDLKDRIFIPKVEKKSYKCIKCHPPRCSIFSEYREVPNSSDYLAYKLCPSDSLRRASNSGNIFTNRETCALCLLCLLFCPMNAIRLEDSQIKISPIPELEDKEYSPVEATLPELEGMTDEIIEKKGEDKCIAPLNRVLIVNTFETRINRNNLNWNQDKFYTWVRNCFRYLGLDVRYTGGKGMKTRSDVTILKPFPVAIEVKSPSEGKVTGKAIRQTDDAAAQLFQKLDRKVYTCAIGQEISPEAERKANEYKKYRESFGTRNFCIPLIPSKVLIYLVLVHQEIDFRENELEIIFRDFHGKIGKEELKKYLQIIDKIRKISKLDQYFNEIDQIFE